MRRVAFGIILAGVILISGGETIAQQDPGDLGEPDSVYVELSQVFLGDEVHLVADVFVRNDLQSLQSMAVMLDWGDPNVVYDSVVASEEMAASLGSIVGLEADTANTYQYQAFGLLWFYGSMPTSPNSRYVGSMYFHMTDPQPGDHICFDTTSAQNVTTLFGIVGGGGAYVPIWGGMKCMTLDSYDYGEPDSVFVDVTMPPAGSGDRDVTVEILVDNDRPIRSTMLQFEWDNPILQCDSVRVSPAAQFAFNIPPLFNPPDADSINV